MSVLVTGISGFVGLSLLEKLKEKTETRFYLLLRDRSYEKYKEILKDFDHLIPVRGNITHPDLILDTRVIETLKEEVNTVIHLAALYDLGAKKEELYLSNVVGTQNILFFCSQLKKVKLIYASTIAVSGDFEGPYDENDYDLGQKFSNPYGKTKFDAEGLVRSWFHDHSTSQVDILRFGIVVGNSLTGEFIKEDGPYYFFKNISKVVKSWPKKVKLPFLPFPFKGKALFPLIPVDIAANCCSTILDKNKGGLSCYHIISNEEPSLKEFLEDFLFEFGHKMNVVSIPESQFVKRGLEKGFSLLQIPKDLSLYLYMPALYRHQRWNKEFPECKIMAYESFRKPLLSQVVKTYGGVKETWERSL